MNIRSAELLQSALQNAANNYNVQRQMQLEAQRNAVEDSYRQAQMMHYAGIEQRYANTADRQSQNEQKQLDQTAIAQKQDILKTVMGLNATGQLDPNALKRVNNWLSTDPDFSKTGMQLTAPPNPVTDPQHVRSALANGIALRQQYQQAYDAEQDPAKKAEYGKILDDIDGAIGGKRGNQRTQSASATGPGSITPAQEKAFEAADNSIAGANSPAINPSGTNPLGFATGGAIMAPAGPVQLTQADLTPITMPQASTAPASGNLALNAKGVPTGKLIKDNSGAIWHYTGNAADPRTDLNAANWQQMPQGQ